MSIFREDSLLLLLKQLIQHNKIIQILCLPSQRSTFQMHAAFIRSAGEAKRIGGRKDHSMTLSNDEAKTTVSPSLPKSLGHKLRAQVHKCYL